MAGMLTVKPEAGKTSPDAIRAQLHLDPKQGAQLDRIVLAGKKVMNYLGKI